MYRFLLFFSIIQGFHGDLVDPENYIINVTANCPPTESSGPATVTVITDLPSSKPFAECSSGQFNFDVDNMGVWSLTVYMELNHTRQCIFYRRPQNSNVYTVSVYVPLSDRVLTINIPEKMVTCVYDPIKEETSRVLELEESQKPPKQIERFVAEPSSSKIKVCVAGVDDKCLESNVRIGSVVKLRAELMGNSLKEQGFKAISCIARGRSYEFPLLTGGCGDGNLIPANLGFTTAGKVALSPTFKAFRVPGSTSLTYDCSFIICSTPCDGVRMQGTFPQNDPYLQSPVHVVSHSVEASSCTKSVKRKKRDTEFAERLQVKRQINNGVVKMKKIIPYSSRQPQYYTIDDQLTSLPVDTIKPEQRWSDVIHSTFWAKETILIILLASITVISMTITARILINITRSVGQLKLDMQQAQGLYLSNNE